MPVACRLEAGQSSRFGTPANDGEYVFTFSAAPSSGRWPPSPRKRRGEGDCAAFCDYRLLPATCGEKVANGRMRGSVAGADNLPTPFRLAANPLKITRNPAHFPIAISGGVFPTPAAKFLWQLRSILERSLACRSLFQRPLRSRAQHFARSFGIVVHPVHAAD